MIEYYETAVSQELGALGGEAASTVKGSHINFTSTLPCLLSGVNITLESIPQVGMYVVW